MKHPRRLFVVGVFTTMLGGSLLYGFRTECTESSVGGIVRRRWRWWRADSILFDRNRDGLVDMKFVYERSSLQFDENSPEDMWEDRDFDGSFDRHVMFAAGQVIGVDIDLNGDGHYEQIIRGDAADRQYRANPPTTAQARSR